MAIALAKPPPSTAAPAAASAVGGSGIALKSVDRLTILHCAEKHDIREQSVCLCHLPQGSIESPAVR